MDVNNCLSTEFALHLFTLRAPEATAYFVFLVFFISSSKTDRALHFHGTRMWRNEGIKMLNET